MFESTGVPIDEHQPLKVVVIGAGIAGVTAGILLTRKVPGIELAILERQSDVGGVWQANVYPGVRCDVPSDVYQSSFAPSTAWTQNYASGAEIKEYWKALANRYDVYKLITFDTLVQNVAWTEAEGLWKIETCATDDAVKKTSVHANFIVVATGFFSEPFIPDIPTLTTYRGHLMHSAKYDSTFDAKDKQVAVIGNGASGLQLVPNLQPVAQRLDHFARSGAWITDFYAGEQLQRNDRTLIPRDAGDYLLYRRQSEARFYKTFTAVFKNGVRNAAVKDKMTSYLNERLSERPDLVQKLMPSFPPGCRQSTPAADYLRAIQQSNANYIDVPIRAYTTKGLILQDGTEHEYDAIICCTGWKSSFPAFPILVDGRKLQDCPESLDMQGHIKTYLGMAAPNVPNLLFLLGPQSAGLAGTVPNTIENQVTYIAKILRKVVMQGVRSMSPTQEATDDFQKYCEDFFPRTVLSEQCRSWYNGGIAGGRVHGLWPGSATHANMARRDVRFEDFQYTYHASSGNRFAWLGNGCSKRDEVADLPEEAVHFDYTPHLRAEALDEGVDLRALHELWYDV